jgi:hypothetical protein
MKEREGCSFCGHEQYDGCLKNLWAARCRCGFGAATCQYCGHVRCVECQPDRWPNLADGCCACLRRLLSRLPGGKASQCREAPRLYGPGLRLVRPAACPFGG